MEYQNHVIDPTYFYDAIEEFSFDYVIFIASKKELDARGRRIISYDKQTIRGSLQSQGKIFEQSKAGNMTTMRYDFYCKSLYRIDIDDVIYYKGNFLMCDSVHDYDEYGVRSATLRLVKLTAYRDLADYVKYLEGQKLI